jgi:hypothetical protein
MPSAASVSCGSQPVATRLTRLATASISRSSRPPFAQQFRAGGRQARLARAAVEQQHVQRVLDLAHAVGQRAGHQAQLARGCGKAAGAGDGLQHRQGVRDQDIARICMIAIIIQISNDAIKPSRQTGLRPRIGTLQSISMPQQELHHVDLAQIRRSRLRRPRLAEVPPQLLVCRLLRPGPHGLGQPARHQRRPHRAGHRLWHPWAPRHGDHQLRAGGRAGPQGQHGQRQGHPAGRRAAHERRAAVCAQRVQPRARGQTTHFLQIWIEPDVPAFAPSYEQKTIPDYRQARALRLVARPTAPRARCDPCRCPLYAGLFDGERVGHAGARSGAQGLRACGARQLQVNGQASRLRATRPAVGRKPDHLDRRPAPRCWCSTWPPEGAFSPIFFSTLFTPRSHPCPTRFKTS